MDKGSSYIMLGIILLVALPFFISSIVKRIKLKKLVERFRKFSEEKNVKVSQYDVIHKTYIIGIDTESKIIVYLDSKNENSGTVISLNGISACKVKISDRNANNEAINLIDLIFSPKDNKQPERRIEMYNYPGFPPRAEDIDIVQKWAEIVNSNLL
jgi:hypothetical protein